MSGWRRSGALVLVAAVLGAALTARLGVWQLDRAAQKTALQSAIDRRGTEPPLDAAGLATAPAQAAAQEHRRAAVRGRWLADRTVFLDNRQMGGRVGFYVVTPLLLAEGDAILVQRGFVARDFVDRTRVSAPPTPREVVPVEGRLAQGVSRLYELQDAGGGAIRQNLDLDAFSREIGVTLRPLVIVQSSSSVDDGLLRDWPAPAVDVHKHYGYAFQWFALSALIIGLYVWFRLLRPRRRRA